MAGVYRGLTIELGADSSSLDAALRKSERNAKSLEKEMKKVSKALTFDGTDSAAYERQMKLLADGAENAKAKVDMLKRAMADPTNQAKMTSDQFTKMQFEIEQAEHKVEDYNAQMAALKRYHDAANGSISLSAEKLSNFTAKVESAGAKMQSAGRALTMGVTVPMTAAATASVKAAVDIDTALTGVRKTVDGTEADYQRLKESAIEFSKSNAVSASQVLDIQALGAQLGFARDELVEFSEVVAGLDIATNIDAETAATQLAQFANVMGMGHDEVDNFASALIELGNNSSTTEADIMNMAMRISGAGKAIGLSSSDVLGLATALSSVGIEAEAGGTAISTIMSNIDKDVATGSARLADWAAAAHMSAEEFANAWNKDAASAFATLMAGMQESVESGGNMAVILDELGVSSLRQTDALKRLAGASELLPRSLKMANDAFIENTALSREVANFNDSLAAKFEMVRNRVIAVAAEIGEPLADAMLDIIDAGEPLFQAIEDGARAFSEMSKEEQQTVIQTAAVVAALGPALTLFGSIAKNANVLSGAMSVLATLLTKLDAATGGVGDGFVKVADASGKMTAQIKPASLAISALKGAAVGLAVAGIAVLAKALLDLKQHADDFHGATDGLRDALNMIDSQAPSAASNLNLLGSTVKGYAGGLDEAAKHQSKFANDVRETFSEVGSNSSLAKMYAEQIKDLTSNFDGSAVSVERLKLAVDGYNQVTGSSVAITDESTGALNISTDALDRNTQAWEANAKAQAAKDLYADAAKEQIKLDEEQAKAREKVAQAEKNLQEARESRDAGKIAEAETALASFNQQEREATALADANREAMDKLSESVASYSEQAKIAQQTTDDFRSAMDSVSDMGFDAFAESLGTNAEDLANALTDAGISAQTFASIGEESFAKLYTSANGDMAKIKGAIDLLNAADLEDKQMTVREDGAIEVEGKILDLNRMTLDGKTVDIYANDYASNTIDSIISKLRGIGDAAISIGINAGGFAAGGISTVPISKIPRHADGGIANRATLTNVGYVGEAGAEAIIPLTNRRYVRPFARAVASEIGGGGTVNNYNINLAYDASADASQMTRDIAMNIKLLKMTEV